MLRKIRIIAAAFCFTLITLLFLDFTGTIHKWFGWVSDIQFMPALLALNVGVVVFLVVLTLVFGRVYCSVICPLGITMDIVSWASRKRKKYRYSYSPAVKWLRYIVLALFCVALIAGISSFASLLEPYSAYGRIASNLFAPLYQWGNNLLAYFAERMDSYAFYSVDVWIKSLSTFIVAIVTLVAISILAWRNGRTYCNTICPVGTLLGFVSRFSIFKPRLDASKCTQCGLCARSCKASCINTKEMKIDYSRCVACMDCLGSCRKDAIKYRPQLKQQKVFQPVQEAGIKTDMESDAGTSRRKFLSITAALAVASTLKAQENKVDGGLAIIEDKKIPKRLTPVKPAGSQSLRNFDIHCTACQLCVSVCPNQVLRPSNNVSKFMQPEMSFERGYCRPECTRCSDNCPTGAIKRIDTAEKSSTQIGHAVWIKANCVVFTDGVSCGNCARHCPTGAIHMVPRGRKPDAPPIPVIDTERCIGCGACEHLCPSRPFSAIYVEGHEVHRTV